MNGKKGKQVNKVGCFQVMVNVGIAVNGAVDGIDPFTAPLFRTN